VLLVHGELDENVPPASTFRLVDALMKADRDFDLLIVPNGHHDIDYIPYVVRRRWDYFVENLLGADPPHSNAVTAGAAGS
jgi:dipeptidyl aminopeptidase/acylaminoacyl peptidase